MDTTIKPKRAYTKYATPEEAKAARAAKNREYCLRHYYNNKERILEERKEWYKKQKDESSNL